MTRRTALAVALSVLVCGCIDSSRVNSTCTWSDSLHRRLDLTQRADRDHLRQDAEVANELMVRAGDAHSRNRPDIARPYRDACTTALVDTIIARHGVTRAQIHAAERDRVWWADFLAVFLPLGLLGAFAVDYITRRVCRSFEPDDRVIATVSIVLLVPIVALLTLGVANFWEFAVEGWRLRNEHVSNRAFFIPIVVHGWIAYFVSLTICASVATARFTRTPLTGGSRRSFATRRVA